MTQRYKLIIEYDGTDFAGWQIQKDQPSIQESIETAIKRYSDEDTRVIGSGRTDSGVHALAMCAHVDIEKSDSPARIQSAINFHLRPHRISILDVEPVDPEFHARFSTTRRHYVYKILNRPAPAALLNNFVWHVPRALDIDKMQAGAQHLIGKHDFTSFRASHCQAKSPIKTLDDIKISRQNDVIEIAVSGRSFLHHQVRNIVGTLKLVGLGIWSENDVKTSLQALNRAKAGPTAPPQGLYFVSADYDEN